MKKKETAAAAAIAALALAFAVPSAIAQGVSDSAPGKNKEAVIAYYTVVELTGSPASESGLIKNLGGAISGGFLGNTANSGVDGDAPDSGHGVTPPASPGPTVGGCNAAPGSSIGHYITGNGPDAVPSGNIPDRC
jgi:hypothetical protein